MEQVATTFSVADDLLTRWHTWLDTDSYWPDWTTFIHGELYQGHVLVDKQERITAVLDWTTAGIGDPASDLMMQNRPPRRGLSVRRCAPSSRAAGAPGPG